MPVSINTLNFKNLTFKSEDDLKQDGMHFVNVYEGKADLQFTIEGQIIDPPKVNDKFGYIGISIEPEMKDQTAMYTLQELFNPEGQDFRRYLRMIGLSEAEFRGCYSGEVKEIFYKNLLYLKLKQQPGDTDKFGFFTNNPEFKPSNLNAMETHDKVHITLRPGLFFNADSGKAGWFFTVKSILFDDLNKGIENKKTATKKKGKAIGN